MKLVKIRIKNYRSIKDSGDIKIAEDLFILAGQNESGKSSILEALQLYEDEIANIETLNFELEKSQNFIQEISCTYSALNQSFYEDVINLLHEIANEQNLVVNALKPDEIVDPNKIKSITEFTVIKRFDFTTGSCIVSSELDNSSLGKIISSIRDYTPPIDRDSKVKRISIEAAQTMESLVQSIWELTPRVILFNNFTDLLPDKIALTELNSQGVKGIKAVKNLESLLKIKFEEIAKKNIPQKISITETESDTLSANFESDWKQRIYGNNQVRIKFYIENNDSGVKELSFFIETKDNEFLAPRKRSKGMIWFLSLWLELKAQENDDPIILLFDEPGQHLHVKANKDMLELFRGLTKKGHQIIYSTHSPSLIETNNLQNIGLVINHEQNGSIVEGLTTTKINTSNKRDALQPIAEAMGMEPLKDFSVLSERNVLVEGLSDFWILKGMSQLLGIKSDYAFIPGVGVKGTKMNPLISFCIGYGLDWLLIMDNGDIPRETRAQLKDDLFFGSEEETDQRIKLLPVQEIENMFESTDLKLIDNTINVINNKTSFEAIGKRNKIIFARIFFTKVEKGEIDKAHFHPETIKRFREVFSWIERQFKKK